MNFEIPEDLNRIEIIAYRIGMQTFQSYCYQVADSIFPISTEPDATLIRANDLATEFFRSFMDLADQRIRFAINDLASFGGYPTALDFQAAAKRSIVTMTPWMTLKNLLEMKEDELVNG
jgi:hypothetical protein